MRRVICCVLAEVRKRVTLCFCLSACPCTMSQMHYENPCVLVQELQIFCCVLISGKLACSLFTITATLVKTRFWTHTVHMLLLLHTGTYWLRVVGSKYKNVGNESYSLNLSTDNWIKLDRKTSEGKRQDSKVNITSLLFNIKETFHTFLCIVMKLPLERKSWLI